MLITDRNYNCLSLREPEQLLLFNTLYQRYNKLAICLQAKVNSGKVGNIKLYVMKCRLNEAVRLEMYYGCEPYQDYWDQTPLKQWANEKTKSK